MNNKEILGLRRITKKLLRDLCKKHRLYQTPHLNDQLYLHYQGFQSIENLEEYTGLKCLWLDSNAISEIEGLDCQPQLKCLFLHNNLIKKIENLQFCTELDTLNLASNHINKIENCGIDVLPVLSTLNLSHNYLRTNEGLQDLVNCKSLWSLDLSHNRIDDILVVKIFANMPELRVLVLQGNPVVSQVPQYRKTLILECKNLTYLDSRPVFPKDRACAEAWKRGGYEEERREHDRWVKMDRKKIRDSVNATLRLRQKHGSRETVLLESTDEDEENRPAPRKLKKITEEYIGSDLEITGVSHNDNSRQQKVEAPIVAERDPADSDEFMDSEASSTLDSIQTSNPDSDLKTADKDEESNSSGAQLDSGEKEVPVVANVDEESSAQGAQLEVTAFNEESNVQLHSDEKPVEVDGESNPTDLKLLSEERNILTSKLSPDIVENPSNEDANTLKQETSVELTTTERMDEETSVKEPVEKEDNQSSMSQEDAAHHSKRLIGESIVMKSASTFSHPTAFNMFNISRTSSSSDLSSIESSLDESDISDDNEASEDSEENDKRKEMPQEAIEDNEAPEMANDEADVVSLSKAPYTNNLHFSDVEHNHAEVNNLPTGSNNQSLEEDFIHDTTEPFSQSMETHRDSDSTSWSLNADGSTSSKDKESSQEFFETSYAEHNMTVSDDEDSGLVNSFKTASSNTDLDDKVAESWLETILSSTTESEEEEVNSQVEVPCPTEVQPKVPDPEVVSWLESFSTAIERKEQADAELESILSVLRDEVNTPTQIEAHQLAQDEKDKTLDDIENELDELLTLIGENLFRDTITKSPNVVPFETIEEESSVDEDKATSENETSAAPDATLAASKVVTFSADESAQSTNHDTSPVIEENEGKGSIEEISHHEEKPSLSEDVDKTSHISTVAYDWEEKRLPTVIEKEDTNPTEQLPSEEEFSHEPEVGEEESLKSFERIDEEQRDAESLDGKSDHVRPSESEDDIPDLEGSSTDESSEVSICLEDGSPAESLDGTLKASIRTGKGENEDERSYEDKHVAETSDVSICLGEGSTTEPLDDKLETSIRMERSANEDKISNEEKHVEESQEVPHCPKDSSTARSLDDKFGASIRMERCENDDKITNEENQEASISIEDAAIAEWLNEKLEEITRMERCEKEDKISNEEKHVEENLDESIRMERCENEDKILYEEKTPKVSIYPAIGSTVESFDWELLEASIRMERCEKEKRRSNEEKQMENTPEVSIYPEETASAEALDEKLDASIRMESFENEDKISSKENQVENTPEVSIDTEDDATVETLDGQLEASTRMDVFENEEKISNEERHSEENPEVSNDGSTAESLDDKLESSIRIGACENEENRSNQDLEANLTASSEESSLQPRKDDNIHVNSSPTGENDEELNSEPSSWWKQILKAAREEKEEPIEPPSPEVTTNDEDSLPSEEQLSDIQEDKGEALDLLESILASVQKEEIAVEPTPINEEVVSKISSSNSTSDEDTDSYKDESLAHLDEKIPTLREVLSSFNKVMETVANRSSERSNHIRDLIGNPLTKDFSAQSGDDINRKFEELNRERRKRVNEMIDKVYAQKDKYDDTLEVVDGRLMIVKESTGELEELPPPPSSSKCNAGTTTAGNNFNQCPEYDYGTPFSADETAYDDEDDDDEDDDDDDETIEQHASDTVIKRIPYLSASYCETESRTSAGMSKEEEDNYQSDEQPFDCEHKVAKFSPWMDEETESPTANTTLLQIKGKEEAILMRKVLAETSELPAELDNDIQSSVDFDDNALEDIALIFKNQTMRE